MLVGYVSDERYVALADVLFEFEDRTSSFEARSRASGAVYADIEPGPYRVALSRPGYGSKRVQLVVAHNKPHHFRLLSDGLLGYAWPKWVRCGERAEFRVHSVEPYKIELWRYGLQKQLAAKIGWFDEHGPLATMQITPDGDYTITGVEWNKAGYGSRQHGQFVTAPEPGGLYYFHTHTDSGRFFSFPWIVAPASPRAKIAVLASNITWNAYNNFGGRSNYIHADELPARPTVNARLELSRYNDPEFGTWNAESYKPLSFDRPEPINHVPLETQVTDPIEGRGACHVAPAEWRLLGWMEREGFEYDLYAETQLHAGPVDLDAYRVLVLSTHPEYWTREMYAAVKQWVFERGGPLMYLGGNGLNCTVTLPDPATMIVHNGDSRKLQANLARYESRLGMQVESEANLLGVVYNDAGVMTAAPYRVLNAEHWIMAGTGLNDGDLFGRASLHERIPGGSVGTRNRQDLTQLAAGHRSSGQGGQSRRRWHDLAYFETTGGGAVFSVGSICWPSSVLVDDAVSRITANVLSRFSR